MSKIQRPHHYDTSHRCKLKDVFEYHDKIDMSLNLNVKYRIFSIMNISKTFEYDILREANRTRHNDTIKLIETKKRKLKMTRKKMTEVDKILKQIENDIDDKVLT